MALAIPHRPRKSSLSGHRKVREEIDKWVWPRPLTFEEFIDLFDGREEMVELINGEVIVEMGALLDHEMLIGWLLSILKVYADDHDLGIVLGSRTPVRIHEFSGRLPDVLFVRADRMSIVQQRAIYGPPDLIIEVRSPGARKSSRIGLEADYRSLEVPEIVFIDPHRKKIRILRKQGEEYSEEEITEGILKLESIPGAEFEVTWLFEEPRPKTLSVVSRFQPPE